MISQHLQDSTILRKKKVNADQAWCRPHPGMVPICYNITFLHFCFVFQSHVNREESYLTLQQHRINMREDQHLLSETARVRKHNFLHYD